MTRILPKVGIGVGSTFCAALVLDSIGIFSPEALAQTYPARPIRIVVASTPGSGPDIVARLLGGKLTEAWGQQIVIDARAGASGRIAAETVARAAPDGYTLLILTSQLATVDAMYKDLTYSLVKDFAPISLLGTATSVLVVTPSLPATSVKELVALAKSRPGVLRYGSSGSGTSFHLVAEVFKFKTGTDIFHVPYKGATPPLTNTMSGEVDMTFTAIAQCLPLIRSSKLRALGISSGKRTTLAPDLPSIAESVPGFDFTSWYGLIAPMKTPSAILSKLNAEIVKALSTSEGRERLASLGIEPIGSSQKDFALFFSAQLEKLREAVKVSGARPDD